jgi:predicted permease
MVSSRPGPVRGAAVGFAGALVLLTGMLFGLFPALHSTRPDLVTALRNNSGKLSASKGAARFRTSLVTAQIALSLALLVSAGLLIQSLRKIAQVDLGVHIDDIVMFRISPARNGYTNEHTHQFFAQLEDQLAAIPGVTAVSAARVGLLAGNNWGNDVGVQGFKKTPDTDANSRFNEIGPGYFSMLGVPLIAGREFTRADVIGSPRVAIVNEAFAKKFGLGRDAVGKLMDRGNDSLDIQIVGLVKDAAYSNVKQQTPPVFFVPYRQDPGAGATTFYAKSARPAAAILPAIRAVVARLDPNLPVMDLKSMPQEVRDNVYLDRMISTLSAAFAALATLLAAIGLYGALAYSVAQRTREIGVRMALGADSSRILSMVLMQVGMMTLVGIVIGTAGALALGRGAESLLFEIKGHDPIVMLLSIVVLTAVALAAGLIPALRASRVDPTQALRYE